VLVQLFCELLESLPLGDSKDGGDFVFAEDVCTFLVRFLLRNIVPMRSHMERILCYFRVMF